MNRYKCHLEGIAFSDDFITAMFCDSFAHDLLRISVGISASACSCAVAMIQPSGCNDASSICSLLLSNAFNDCIIWCIKYVVRWRLVKWRELAKDKRLLM
jgi:hypothetical protein